MVAAESEVTPPSARLPGEGCARRTRRGRSAPLPVRDGLNPSRVRTGDEPMRAGDVLLHVISTQRRRHPHDGPEAIAARFARGEVRLRDGRPLAPDDLLDPGTDLWFYRMPAPETPVPGRCEVIFQDDSIMVISKPAFLATMPRGAHITESVVVKLRSRLDEPELAPAHRLDRLTSGLLLLTRRREVRGAYQELFASRTVTKTYCAIAPLLDAPRLPLHWTEPLRKTRGDLAARIDEQGAACHTEVADCAALPAPVCRGLTARYGLDPGIRLGSYTLLPHTGRTHQLRAHMSAHGVPILGDPLYPVVHDDAPDDFTRPLLLHAESLSFRDPISGTMRSFTATPEWAVS
ncbi:pseudouridine synthase [Corynebacterium uberis]|uniref:pseudouridine synthase n=1 Tax=Corynebacterium TaxID=1716 RepID=UPI001D0B1ACC|nr:MULTISPECIES: pseudouridine synthase [Corynebacterium]MCZ9309558.1 pseudouridine synthase [Corynebacterium sp. c6VSa_13]UDL73372.1 23S rRNA pseudouridylate synthase [Corynebacterium uberis]UDL75749.1 23S rRNA pseudouridylate synthase [Corynebacterium uberis]UDL77961.1 23S rRNA pseudouridylate synthase [Corynebacterium uberis]UDL80245.1 23S rRNA pseudouridylate synthase [Corynebacterium uberis]